MPWFHGSSTWRQLVFLGVSQKWLLPKFGLWHLFISTSLISTLESQGVGSEEEKRREMEDGEECIKNNV